MLLSTCNILLSCNTTPKPHPPPRLSCNPPLPLSLPWPTQISPIFCSSECWQPLQEGGWLHPEVVATRSAMLRRILRLRPRPELAGRAPQRIKVSGVGAGSRCCELLGSSAFDCTMGCSVLLLLHTRPCLEPGTPSHAFYLCPLQLVWCWARGRGSIKAERRINSFLTGSQKAWGHKLQTQSIWGQWANTIPQLSQQGTWGQW